jgi:hypothetical protein
MYQKKIAIGKIYQNGDKNYQMAAKNIPKWRQKLSNGDKKYTKWPRNIPKNYITRPSEIDQSWHFWYENIPSGNPALDPAHA